MEKGIYNAKAGMKMKPSPLLLISVFFICFMLNTQAQTNDNDYLKLLKDIENLTIVGEAKLPAEGITITKDSISFILSQGNIYKFTKVSGRDAAILFKGKGHVVYTPPTQVEQEQLERVLNYKQVNHSFDELFLFFSDTTNIEYFANLEYSNSTDIGFIQGQVEYFTSFIYKDEYGYLDNDFAQDFLDKKNNRTFHAHIEFDHLPTLFYKINPYEREEVSLSKKISRIFSISRARDIVNSFSLDDKNPPYTKFEDSFIPIDISLYKINLRISEDLETEGSCEISYIPTRPDTKWLRLFLHSELNVDSIKFNNVVTNEFYRHEDNPELWIKLPEYSDTETKTLTINYHGDMFTSNEEELYSINSPDNWYPNLYDRINNNFEIDFVYPSKYTLVSIGERTSYHQTEDSTMSSWSTTTVPAYYASFNLGKFKTFTFTEEGLPKVNVHLNPDIHRFLAHELVKEGILSGADMEEKIGSDVLASLKFYQTVFGKIDINNLNVTEIPRFYGLAFPGLIYLSWYNYQGIEYDRAGELFRAHEVAHQWWGITVDFENYHDQWLSEGFAEFSALYFIQAGFGNEDYFDILDKWKTKIFNNRKYLLGDGQEAGPVWLGRRNSSSETAGDYSVIVYQKGAWVLHMIRGLLLDLKTMNEDKFSGLMKEFFNTHKGKRASTNDFKRLVDKYSGENMRWFFDQFIYGTSLPHYTFSYTTEEQKDGKFVVVCKILQENVPDDFKMYIPIKIVLDDDQFARLRIEVKGKETIVRLPPIPGEPDEIIFNDLNSVLCEVDYD